MDLDNNNNNNNNNNHSSSNSKRVFQRLRAPPAPDHSSSSSSSSSSFKHPKVCFHWQAGRCTRFPCPFLHTETPPSNNGHLMTSSSKRAYADNDFSHSSSSPSSSGFSVSRPRRNPNFSGASSTWGGVHSNSSNRIVRKTEKLCSYWLSGKCSYGDGCKFLHSWSVGEGFKLLTQLEGHQKVVSGISLPSGSDKLYTGGKDETVRLWDCQSGQCLAVISLGSEVGCMIVEGPWLFVGVPNFVKAWNTQTSSELSLSGPAGQVYALAVGNSMLFAGTQDGSILAWKFNAATNNFEPVTSLTGHSGPVVSFVVGANRLYSGSMDKTIKVWNLETLQCLQTLTGHTSVVMSVLCWDQFLLSGSLDKSVKVWVATESGNLEVTYTHTEEDGVLKLCGMHDSQGKPILLCSCNNNIVHLYDLPSFAERGKIFSKQEVRAIEVGPSGIFFTGDAAGQVKVWNWLPEPSSNSINGGS